MAEWTVLRENIAFGESVRWHRDRVWFCDWGAQEIVAIGPEGVGEVVVGVPFPSMAMCIDWLPDGRLLIVSSSEARVVRLEADGSLVTHADLRALGTGFNEIVVHERGHVYVNAIGFDMGAGEAFRPGFVALIDPDGSARRVAEDVVFPNGMAVSPDGSTLILAESYGHRLTAFDIAPDGGLSRRRVWADLGDGVPDGICVDAEGAVWYADVPNKRCVRVREGGEVLRTIEFDRGCFSCALGGADGTTLFVVATEWHGLDALPADPRTGRLVAVPCATGAMT